MEQEPKYLLIVRAKAGLKVRDTPRPESEGGVARRSEPVGKQLYAYDIHWIGPVQYARLVPQNPLKPEWVRVAEADNSVVYVDVIALEGSTGGDNGVGAIAAALNRIADALLVLAGSKK